MAEEHIRMYTQNSIGVIELNRPQVMNALNRQMVDEIVEQAEAFDKDSTIRVIVIKGNDKAFAAGADIEEMKEESPIDFELADPFAVWDRLHLIKKPILASVNGFALGGGFELALHCDVIVAGEQAKFGFPEVTLGVMPGAGGTQLLSRAMGTRRALEWIWLGEMMEAATAYTYGIINRIVAPEMVVVETMQLAEKLANQPPISLRLIKETVQQSDDLDLMAGKKLERKNFYLAFDSSDQKEGMQAFVEKRPPHFKGE